MPAPNLRLTALALVLPLLAGTLSACTSASATTPAQVFCSRAPQSTKPTPVTHHAVIVIGNVANSPKWRLTTQQKNELTELIAAGGRVDLVSTAGDGQVCLAESLRLQQLKPDMNAAGRDATIRDNLKRVTDELANAPRVNGQDVYAALHLAADQLKTVNAQHRSLFVLASGLNDHGLLDSTPEGALGADVDETLRYLTSSGLPSFAGVRVLASGFGYTTPPQKALDAALRRSVADTYAAILRATAPDAEIDPAPATGDAIDTLGRTVKPVEPPVTKRPPQCSKDEVVFDQASALRFHGDSTEFIDRDAALAALAPIVTWLKEESDRRVDILGTTARGGSREGQEALGRGRADVVRDLLLGAGVDAAQITSVTSHGSYFPDYVDDQAPGGGLLPAPASRNRSVRLTLTDPC